jgi:hypothetical protein
MSTKHPSKLRRPKEIRYLFHNMADDLDEELRIITGPCLCGPNIMDPACDRSDCWYKDPLPRPDEEPSQPDYGHGRGSGRSPVRVRTRTFHRHRRRLGRFSRSAVPQGHSGYIRGEDGRHVTKLAAVARSRGDRPDSLSSFT